MSFGTVPDNATLLDELGASRERIRHLEARLEECEDTLEAIRSGSVDAVVVLGPDADRQVYTLESADQPYRVLIEQIQEGALTLSRDGAVLYCNPRLAEMLGGPQERVMGRPIGNFVCAEDQESLAAMLRAAGVNGARRELSFKGQGDSLLPMLLSLSLLDRGDGSPLLCGVVTDLTQQKMHLHELAVANERLRAESLERERIEEVLRQSQKMEAVGQLTGGLAHDFNNLLAVVTGNLELMAMRLGKGRFNDLGRFMASAQAASKRATALTHRLLAFSRRQTLDPKVTGINELVNGIRDMVNRTVGPEVAVDVVAAPNLWTTFVDPNQLENALLNLCINARDAMPDGGQLTVETSNQDLGKDIASVRDLLPGQYVALSVSDNGTGMSPEVIARVFEPFFTTKPTGQGTGLGLSMVYGFARQSEGQVRIHSEVGRGTTVTVYLPRSDKPATADNIEPVAAPQQAQRGRTILVVDDEAAVRMLVSDVLRDLGYRLIEAGDGPTALKILETGDRVDLLITDVGMPIMNGRQLADAARTGRPDLKTLFITGYAEASVISHGDLDAGMAIMTKPFALDVLANRVKAMIETPNENRS